MRAAVFDPAGLEANRFTSDSIAGTEIVWTESLSQLSETGADEPLFAVGERALLELVADPIDGPVVPVGVDAGVPAVPLDAFENALGSLSDGRIERQRVPTISASLGTNQYRALMDIMAVTAEPARISEFRTRKGQSGTVIDQVRADGMSVSGPAGTPGYGTAAGGPILDPEVGGLAVVPVGQFRTDHPHWVLDPPIEIEVIREEVPVSLVVDDRTVDSIPAGEPLVLTLASPLDIGILDQSRSHLSRYTGD